MRAFTFVFAVALAIACNSLGSTRAAPTSAASSCQPVCQNGEYCDEKSSSCTLCLNCTHYQREPGRDGCAKIVEDCGQLDYEYDDKGANSTELEPGVRHGGDEGAGKHPTIQPAAPTNKDTDHVADYLPAILASVGILAAIVISLVCALDRRPCSLAEGSWQWAKRPRTEEQGVAHFHNVPDGDELGQGGVDGDVQFYGQNQGRPARNEDAGHKENVALLGNAIREQRRADPAKAQQHADLNALDEVSVPLDPDRGLASPAESNIEERENANEREVGNIVNGAEEEQYDDEAQLQVDNGEDHVEDGKESGNDSGLGDDDRYEAAEHEVPQSPSSSAIQAPQSAENNSAGRISNSHPHPQVQNQVQPQITPRADRERSMNLIVKHKHKNI